MNEKIKTILQTVKGGMYIPLGYSSPQGSTNYWGMSDEELQKFAELIIKECAKIADERQFKHRNNYPISIAIEEHFGVE